MSSLSMQRHIGVMLDFDIVGARHVTMIWPKG